MPNLWDALELKPNTDIVLPGETVPAVFWNAVARRGDAVWMREKQLGIWRRPGPGTRWRRPCARSAHGLMALGFAPGERVSILSNTVVEWVLADLATLSAGGVSSGIYPTDSAGAGAVPVRGLGHRAAVRRRRRAARQGAGSAAAAAAAAQDRRLRHGRPARPGRPRRDRPGRAARAGPRAPGSRTRRRWSSRIAALDPAALAILVYTSGTTGKPKGAMHNHRSLVAAMRGYHQVTAQYESDERMCFLPLCHIAERMGGEYFAMYTRREAELRREPRHRARERARDRADRRHRGAAGVGEVLFGRHHRREGSQPRAAAGLRLGPGRGHAGGRARAGRPAGAGAR